MRKKKYTIAIVYHSVDKKSGAYPSKENFIVDHDTGDNVTFLAKMLRRRRYDVRILRVAPGDLNDFRIKGVDYIFNQVDSRAMELRFARILDRMNIPHSGSSYQAILASNNKIKSKSVFEKHHLPIARYALLRLHQPISKRMLPAPYPLIIKPAFEHCSVGITDTSVVESYEQVKHTVRILRKRFHQALIIEEYIPGREFHIPVFQTFDKTVALPVAEYIYTNHTPNNKRKWNIYGFDEKWSTRKKTYKNWKFISPPKRMDKEIVQQMQRDAVKAFYAFEFRDYARFDLRYNPKKEQWYFLEGNANSDMNPSPREATTASIVAAGMTSEEFVMQIIKNSLPV